MGQWFIRFIGLSGTEVPSGHQVPEVVKWETSGINGANGFQSIHQDFQSAGSSSGFIRTFRC
jgi:hypothetical protein